MNMITVFILSCHPPDLSFVGKQSLERIKLMVGFLLGKSAGVRHQNGGPSIWVLSYCLSGLPDFYKPPQKTTTTSGPGLWGKSPCPCQHEDKVVPPGKVCEELRCYCSTGGWERKGGGVNQRGQQDKSASGGISSQK